MSFVFIPDNGNARIRVKYIYNRNITNWIDVIMDRNLAYSIAESTHLIINLYFPTAAKMYKILHVIFSGDLNYQENSVNCAYFRWKQ